MPMTRRPHPPASSRTRAFAAALVGTMLLSSSALAADAPAAVPGKWKPRAGDWSVKTGEAMNSGSFVLYATAGAPFLGVGVLVGIARRLNVGVSLKSVYTLRNAPELDLKLNLLAPKTCGEPVGGTPIPPCIVKHALALGVSGGVMFGGTIPDTTTFSNGEVRNRLSGLPTYVDDTNHIRVLPALIYSYSGGPFAAFMRLQVLIQKFLEDDPTGTPRDAINLHPEAVAGFEMAVGTRLHFWLEGGMGPYLDWNHAVEGMLLETERRITLAGHVEAGLALHLY